jgi:hypothetical protein
MEQFNGVPMVLGFIPTAYRVVLGSDVKLTTQRLSFALLQWCRFWCSFNHDAYSSVELMIWLMSDTSRLNMVVSCRSNFSRLNRFEASLPRFFDLELSNLVRSLNVLLIVFSLTN